MLLTLQRRNHHNPDSFPTAQLFLLAICRVAEPIALTSIFPYAWPMVKSFHIGEEKDASFYAGILISSFALSESLTGMYWGSLSDRVGRKPILLLGCAGTMLSMLIMGFATNFWVALLARSLGGILNGNIAIIQTMVGELVKKPEHEPRAYAVMPFVWCIGTVIGPSIGGIFAGRSETGLFATFPYLLPNLICAILLLMSILAGYFLLEETHPDLQPWSTRAELEHTAAQTPLMATAGSIANPGVDLRADSYGTFNQVDIQEEHTWTVNSDGSPRDPPPYPPPEIKVFSRRVVMLVVALGILTYHTMTYDHLLPIFFHDDKTKEASVLAVGALDIPGGLGLSVHQTGLIMSVNGLIALFVQAIMFPLFAEWLGVWRLFLFVTILHPIAYFMVPFLALLPDDLLFPGIYVCLTIRNFFSIMAYPVILILLKEASPKPSCLGKINGLAASVSAACRTVSPVISGLLYGVGSGIGFTGVAWWGSGIVAIFGAIQLCWMEREKNKTAVVRAPYPVAADLRRESKEIVRILVTDV